LAYSPSCLEGAYSELRIQDKIGKHEDRGDDYLVGRRPGNSEETAKRKVSSCKG
jgi:hypothetical protein